MDGAHDDIPEGGGLSTVEVDVDPDASRDAAGVEVALVQGGSELVALLAGEAEFGGAGGAKVAVGCGAGDEDGDGAAGVVRGGPPAGDGEDLLAAVLVLKPGAAASARLVRRVEAFGDDALWLVGARDLEDGIERAVKRRGDSPARSSGGERPREQLAAAVVRQGAHGAAIEMQHVKADQRRGIAARRRACCRRVGCGEAPAQAVEVRMAVGVQADELAVQQDLWPRRASAMGASSGN